MARDKERTVNPATAALKADKARTLRKSKADQQARRNVKLAHRNPERLQRQIDDLKALEASGAIKTREKQTLAELERDVKAIRKARETLGDKAPAFGGGRRDGAGRGGGGVGGAGVLGKRAYDGQMRRGPPRSHGDEPEGSDTDESVRNIPMPRDTPPPTPRPQRPFHPNQHQQHREQQEQQQQIPQTNPHSLPPRPPAAAEVKTTYSSAPQLRDLKREAVSRFVPAVVRRKKDAVRGAGAGALLEPEEMDRLEAQGYVQGGAAEGERERGGGSVEVEAKGGMGEGEGEGKGGLGDEDSRRKTLEEEEARFQKELEMDVDVDEVEQDGLDAQTHGTDVRKPLHAQVEEVDDEDM